MKDIYLLNYSVKGIKSIDRKVTLSFYKKTISREMNTQNYNIKGIYGMNGSGKSGIVASVEILKNILTNPGYLNNPVAQENLKAIINKKTRELYIEADYACVYGASLKYFRYKVKLSEDSIGKFIISYEQLSSKNINSKSDSMKTIFEVNNGELDTLIKCKDSKLVDILSQKTINLLSAASMCALFYEKFLAMKSNDSNIQETELLYGMCALWFFGKKLHVYVEQSDDHRNYLVQNSIKSFDELDNNKHEIDSLIKHFSEMNNEYLNIISVQGNIVAKTAYGHFENTVNRLYKFLRIFKSDLKGIEIDKKENREAFICQLIMVYEDYKIHVEFESTGIKKLIRLFAYLKEMAQGGIVFIDEFDSNLHDVYLCALLEYLMEYGKGQLCFTTHNVGPMDILRRNKKSIDFLSEEHEIYPWKTNGNYSPSTLYRNGMIEGSPFNVYSIDFIRAFSSTMEED